MCRVVVTVCVLLYVCVCMSETSIHEEENRRLIHLILDIQRTFLFMEEFQGLYVAMPRCVVDSIGSSLKVQRRKKYSRIYP